MNDHKMHNFEYPLPYRVYCVTIMICWISLDLVCFVKVLGEGINGLLENILFAIPASIGFLYLTIASILNFMRSIETIKLSEERICVNSLFGEKELKIKNIKTVKHNFFLETTVFESEVNKIKVKNQLLDYDRFYNILIPCFSNLDRYYDTKMPIETCYFNAFKYLPIGIIIFCMVGVLLWFFKAGKMPIIELMIIETICISSLVFVWYIYAIMSPRRCVFHDTHIEMIWVKNRKIYKIKDITEVKYRRSFFNALASIDLRFSDNTAVILSQSDLSYPLQLLDELYVRQYCNSNLHSR